MGKQRALMPIGAMRKAMLHDLMTYLSTHPFALITAELTRFLGSVGHVPRLGYVVQDADVAKRILLDDKGFTKHGPGSSGAIWTQLVGNKALTNMEGEEHRRLRSELNDIFSESQLRTIDREVIEDAAARLRRGLGQGHVVDLVPFARFLSAKAIYFILGMTPDTELEERTYMAIFEHSEKLSSRIGITTTRLSDDEVMRAQQELGHLLDFTKRCYEGGHIRSGSVIDRLSQTGMSFDDMRGIVAVLLLQGTGTVSSAIPRIVALLIDSGELTRLRSQPALLSNAVDEGLRYVVPAPITLRSVAEDRRIGTYLFRVGRRVLISTYNIMRDPRYYPRPREFNITRKQPPDTRHLWFGRGPHFCVGSDLARLEIQVVIQALLDTGGDIKIVKRRYRSGTLLPGYSKLALKVFHAGERR